MNSDDPQLVTRYDDIYNLPDCRAYYRAMYQASFKNAHYAVQAFKIACAEISKVRSLDYLNVVDFASGYGIGSLLLRHNVSLQDVLSRYQAEEFFAATPSNVIEWDRCWLEENRSQNNIKTIGAIDVADHALDYGLKTGIFDFAWAIDLQSGELPDKLIQTIEQCDLIVEVGSVLHMLPDTLRKIIELAGDNLPWIITSPIRGNESEESISLMQEAGMVVEALPVKPFPHREFMDKAEQGRAISLVNSRGMDTEGYESQGSFHAQLYLSRPGNESAGAIDWNTVET